MKRIAPIAGSGRTAPSAILKQALLLVPIAAACAALVLLPRTAAAASPRLQVFFAADFTDVPYQQEVYKRVAAVWQWPAEMPKPGSKAVVIISISRNGDASAPALHLKSGSAAWDAAAMEAVRRATPFAPLPKNYRPPSVEVHFHFGYEK
jgi:periplasmic protein TonB